jgi:Leucine-rich repeat (LRR) protein
MDQSMLPVLKVLQRLPGGLGTEVLAASPADLEDQLSILPPSMHPLAVHAAFPSIICDHSLKLNSAFLDEKSLYTINAVMKSATTAPNFLNKLDLSHIPRQIDTRLLQLIAAACMNASDVSLMFDCQNLEDIALQQPVATLHEALSYNTSLTCLKLSFTDALCDSIGFDYLLSAFTGLQTLSLANYQPRGDASCTRPLHIPMCIVNQLSLTQLCLGPGFHLTDLPQILPQMAPLKVLDLTSDPLIQLQELPDLSHLTALQTLQLKAFKSLSELPPLATLTALQTLEVSLCEMLQQLPPVVTLTALHTLKLCNMFSLSELPPLDTLRALQTLELRSCDKLQRIPSLAALTALQTLRISNCRFMHAIPTVGTLTALQTLELGGFGWVHEIPPLDTLTALQTLEVTYIHSLKRLPSLASLTALRELKVEECFQLRELPPLDTLTALQTIDLSSCIELERVPSLSNLSALQTIVVRGCQEGLESTFQDTLPSSDVKIRRSRQRDFAPLRQ